MYRREIVFRIPKTNRFQLARTKYSTFLNTTWPGSFTINKIPVNYFQEQKSLCYIAGMGHLLLLLYTGVRTNVRTNKKLRDFK